MDNSGTLRPLDESLLRELPQLGASLRIAPLREPVSSRTTSAPSPLEPNASGAGESTSINATPAAGGSLPANAKAGLPTVRTKRAEPAATDAQSNVEPPPRPILPAFVNLRALERSPFAASFDDDALQGPRKRRRFDLQADSFSEHLQLPIPQAQKEQRPPPFGPFAILNGLNEPPPNAAILPPIEAGSISQLLTKPSRDDAAVDPGSLVPSNGIRGDGQPVERREARVEELLDATLDDNDEDNTHDHDDTQRTTRSERGVNKSAVHENDAHTDKRPTFVPDGDAPLSPKTRGRSRKNVRKWTEEETMDLLRGVVKCGIGNWTTILAQPELKFNKRTASNLKDRFRVCYPWAYSASDTNEATKHLRDELANTLLKAQAQKSEDAATRMPPPRPSLASASSGSSSGSLSSTNSSHKTSTSSISSSTPDTDYGSVSTQHTPPPAGGTTSQTTLESLGLPEAHVTNKAKRRHRRPFTTVEDDALLKGYAVHGFQWTLIQQDKRLNLGHRRATDLRDRFRTKFPHAYRDGGSVSGNQDATPGPSKSAPQDRHPSSQGSPTKAQSTGNRREAQGPHVSTASHSNQGSVDTALLPPPPQGFLEPSANNMPAVSGLLSFPLDDNSAAGASSPWEDNTLAPMVWDDLG